MRRLEITPVPTTLNLPEVMKDRLQGQVIKKVKVVGGGPFGSCYDNSRQYSEDFGGSVVFGWKLYDYWGAFFECVHHAVWDNGKQLLCVTEPAAFCRERKIISFLPSDLFAPKDDYPPCVPNVFFLKKNQPKILGIIDTHEKWIAKRRESVDLARDNQIPHRRGEGIILTPELYPKFQSFEREEAELKDRAHAAKIEYVKAHKRLQR